jgi:thiol-disulfide isomerase/thioredoxin
MKPSLAFAILLTFSCSAMAESKLTVGDPAPAIKTGEWIQGDPVTELNKGTVYVVEFWATWCVPCVAAIPHLDQLHEELKDCGVVIIGQNCSENNREKVKPFVAKMGEKMSYRVAMDDVSAVENGYMMKNWMNAAGLNGIPTSFIVGKDGRIAWIGQPTNLSAGMLKQIVAGTFDSKTAAATFEISRDQDAIQDEADKKLRKALSEKDWATATATLDELEKTIPELSGRLGMSRFSISLGKGDNAAVVSFIDNLVAAPGQSPQVLQALMHRVALEVATEMENPSPEALAAAGRAAEKGLTAGHYGGALYNALARVQFMQGLKEQAVSTQEKAVANATERNKATFEDVLESYKKGALPEAVPSD